MKIITFTLMIILFAYLKSYSQDFWERTNGLDNLIIYSLAINSNGDIFAGTDSSGLFRSTDNGTSWTNLGFTYDWIRSGGIAINPTDEIYLVTDNHFANGGVMKSTDNGDTWDTLGLTFNAETFVALNSTGDIFAGTAAQGVYRSTDNGESFDQINVGIPDSGKNPISFTINSIGDIFVGTVNAGVFKSTDNGNNWVQINSGITNYQILALGINANGDILAGTSGGGIFQSTDNGANWSEINDGLTGQALYAYAIAVNSNGVIFIGTDDGAFKSTNNGENWSQINQGLTNTRVYSLAINPNGDIFAGTQDGVFITVPSVKIKVYLQGPYSSGSMSTTLRDNGYIPLTQPYNVSPFNYNGSESVASIPAGVVDWVLLELRSDFTTQVSRRAAFLLSDGSVVDIDVVNTVKFPGVTPGDYYVVVRHRNHLAVMTANPVTLSYSPEVYDFTTGLSKFYGVDAANLSGVFGMHTGDTNADGIVDAADRSNAWNDRLISGYEDSDVTLDGIVDAADRSEIWNKRLIQTKVP